MAHPEAFQVLRNVILAEPCEAEAAESMCAALRLIEFGQDGMQ
jgi:hypothetical protein